MPAPRLLDRGTLIRPSQSAERRGLVRGWLGDYALTVRGRTASRWADCRQIARERLLAAQVLRGRATRVFGPRALFHSALILTLPLSGVATLASLQTQPSAQAAAATPAASGISWLAAGDSYSSGQGLPTTEPPCAQGDGLGVDGSTWSTVASEQLGIGSFEAGSPDLRACTGTISDQFFNNHGGGDDPQWSKSMGRYDLVSFSFGGNDIGFASIIQHCVIQGGCPPESAVRQKIAELGTTGVYKGSFRIPPFPEFLTHVATSAVAHGGNVVVMGYPELIANPDDWPTGMTKCDGHFSKNTADEMRGWAGDLNATLGSSVTKVNALVASKRNDVHFTFVNPVTGGGLLSPDDENLFEPANGPEHELCATGNAVWMNGLQIENLNGSFHPNQSGEAAMGVLGAEVIRQLKWDIAPGWRQLGDPPVEPTEDATIPQLSCASGPFCMETWESSSSAAVWTGGYWTRVAAPAWLISLSCTSATFCMGVYSVPFGEANDNPPQVVNHTSYAVKWNGNTWSTPMPLDSYNSSEGYGTVQDVSCTSTTFCMAIGGDFGSTVWNGSLWRKVGGQTTGTDGGALLSCVSPAFCMAAPAAPHTIEWNGKAWGPATQAVPESTTGGEWLSNLACLSPTRCYGATAPAAYGGQDPFIFDGTNWHVGAVTATPASTQISCAGLSECAWISDANGGVSTLEGGRWSPPVTLGPGVDDTAALSCAPSFCVVTMDYKSFIFSTTLEGRTLAAGASSTGAPTAPTSAQSGGPPSTPAGCAGATGPCGPGYEAARSQWYASLNVSGSYQQSVPLLAAITDLTNGLHTDVNTEGYQTALGYLENMSKLPDAMLTPGEDSEFGTDAAALDSFFDTPGLYSFSSNTGSTGNTGNTGTLLPSTGTTGNTGAIGNTGTDGSTGSMETTGNS